MWSIIMFEAKLYLPLIPNLIFRTNISFFAFSHWPWRNLMTPWSSLKFMFGPSVSSFKVHSSTSFCALGVGCLHQHTLPLGLSWLGQWEPWQVREGKGTESCVFITLPVSLFGLILDCLLLSLKCPSPHSLCVSKFQSHIAPSGLWVLTGTTDTNSALSLGVHYPLHAPLWTRRLWKFPCGIKLECAICFYTGALVDGIIQWVLILLVGSVV